jgi:hypothetical protein
VEPGELEGERRAEVGGRLEPLAPERLGVDELRVHATTAPLLGEAARRVTEVGGVEAGLRLPVEKLVRESTTRDRPHRADAVAEPARPSRLRKSRHEPLVEQGNLDPDIVREPLQVPCGHDERTGTRGLPNGVVEANGLVPRRTLDGP